MSFYTPRKPAPARATPAPKPLLGTEIAARCRKCRGVTKHIVRAKVGVKPTQVQCLTCNAEHPYSSPQQRRAAAAAPRELSWAEAIGRAQGEAKAYSMIATYGVGTRVRHESFGEGVVLRLSSPTVCEVLFESRTVKLVMTATKSTFVAPEPREAAGRRRRRFA
jgi:hypothetical protein